VLKFGASDEEFFNYIKTLSPAAIDLELRSLVTLDSLGLFMNALVRRLRSRKDFEAVQTFQSVFLRIHGEVLVGNPELREKMETLLAAQRSESERVLGLITSSLGTLDFVRDTL
jgi:U3 small nucleolar RNA-associated protein 21